MVSQPRENWGRKAFFCFGIFCCCSVCCCGRVSGSGGCVFVCACVRARTRACTHTTGSSTFHLADVARWAWPNPLTITWHTGSEPCQGPVAAPAERDIKGRLAQFSAGKWPACLPNEETGLRQGMNLFKVTQRSMPRLGLILRLPMDQG